MPTLATGSASGARRGPWAGAGVVLAGAVALAAAAFVHAHTPLGGSLWAEGTGWVLVALAVAVAVLSVRAARRGTASWSALWIGLLAAADGLAIAREQLYGSGTATHLLDAAGLLILAGWAVAFAASRPEIAGLGPWRALPARVWGARPARHVVAPNPVPRVWPLGLYLALSFVFFALPVIGSFGSALIAENDIDPSVFTWFYAWWPHALLHGHDPFLTHAIFPPGGYNLTWVTSVPLPSLLLAPVTLAFGPVVSFNVVMVVAPAFAAWTAFLLCRHLTRSLGPSLLAGYVFGFSAYMLQMLQGSPSLLMTGLLPLLVLLVVRHLEGSARDRTLVLGGGALIAAQFASTLELAVTGTLFGALTLLAAFVLLHDRRRAIVRTAVVCLGAYAFAALLVSPLVVAMLTLPHTTPYQNTPLFAADLGSLVTPDPSMLVATGHDLAGPPPWFGGPAYVGLPLLLIVGALAWSRRRERAAGVAVAAFLIPLVLALGPRLTVGGHRTPVGLPWGPVAHLPGIHSLIPVRFADYAFLAGAVLVALWLARARRPAAWALGGLCALTFVPWVGSAAFRQPLTDPPFFATGAYRDVLGPRDHVMTVPPIGESMRWQARTKFRFVLAGGYVGAYPDAYRFSPTFNTLLGGHLTPDYAADLRQFVREHGVTAVVVDAGSDNATWRRLFGTLGVPARRMGGVVLYRLPRPGAPR